MGGAISGWRHLGHLGDGHLEMGGAIPEMGHPRDGRGWAISEMAPPILTMAEGAPVPAARRSR